MDINQVVERAKAILLNPKPTWEIIKEETKTVGQVYREYLVPLAVVPAVAMFIGRSVIGVSYSFMGYYRQPIVSGLVTAVLLYVLTLVGIFIMGKIIDAVAPTFGATRNDLNAFKVAAYAWTPALIAGIVNIIPMLAPVGLLASLYGIYLLYLGLLVLMACPAEKAVGYTVVCVVVMAVIYVLVGSIVGGVATGFHPRLTG